jgi:hypothetical protein
MLKSFLLLLTTCCNDFKWICVVCLNCLYYVGFLVDKDEAK